MSLWNEANLFDLGIDENDEMILSLGCNLCIYD